MNGETGQMYNGMEWKGKDFTSMLAKSNQIESIKGTFTCITFDGIINATAPC